MGRIDTILESAASTQSKLEDALLQCKILAAELDFEPLNEWASNELDGYKSLESLPDYRMTRSAFKGMLIEGRSYSQDFQIPSSWIPEDLREMATTVYTFGGVGYLASLNDDGSLQQRHQDVGMVEGLINSKIQKEYGRYIG